MKQRIYEIIIISLLIFITLNAYKFFKMKKQETQIAYAPIEENISKVNEVSNEPTKIKEIDSDVTDWNLILVNKNNLVPDNYKFKQEKINEKYEVDTRIKEALEEMLESARKEGLDPLICSAYRTHQYQVQLYNKKVSQYINKGYTQEDAEKEASLWVTTPGTSEHEIGLAVDIVSQKYQILDKNQEDTGVQKWLMEHCYEYGFVLRYPTDKKEITQINYEPWHYRYVGVKDAMFMKEKGFCLEEYIEFLEEQN